MKSLAYLGAALASLTTAYGKPFANVTLAVRAGGEHTLEKMPLGCHPDIWYREEVRLNNNSWTTTTSHCTADVKTHWIYMDQSQLQCRAVEHNIAVIQNLEENVARTGQDGKYPSTFVRNFGDIPMYALWCRHASCWWEVWTLKPKPPGWPFTTTVTVTGPVVVVTAPPEPSYTTAVRTTWIPSIETTFVVSTVLATADATPPHSRARPAEEEILIPGFSHSSTAALAVTPRPTSPQPPPTVSGSGVPISGARKIPTRSQS